MVNACRGEKFFEIDAPAMKRDNFIWYSTKDEFVSARFHQDSQDLQMQKGCPFLQKVSEVIRASSVFASDHVDLIPRMTNSASMFRFC